MLLTAGGIDLQQEGGCLHETQLDQVAGLVHDYRSRWKICFSLNVYMRAVCLLACLTTAAFAQVPNLLGRSGTPAPLEPSNPPARHVHDERDRLSFDLPAGWNFSRHDGEFSTFALDARSALRSTQLHAAADIDFNPLPYSTFSGALFYISATPHSTPLACSNQSVAPASHPVANVAVDGIPFRHGYTEHGGSCIESRDEVYTSLRGSSCLRIDLVINTFCGGEASGARDMTPAELNAVRRRLEMILQTIHMDDAHQPGSAGNAKPTLGSRLKRSPSAQ